MKEREIKVPKDPKEIEKEMDNYRIITLGDIYRALRDHPDWAQELRRVFLTEELIDLPKKFQDFLQNDFYPLKEKVDKIEKDVEILKQDVAILKQDVAILKQDVAILKQDVAKLKIDVGWLKGGFMELLVRDKVGAFFGRLLKKASLLDTSELADSLYDSVEKGIISSQDAQEALRVDAVVRGFLRKDGPKEVLIAAEISFVVDKEDVQRAAKRAMIIAKVLGKECIPAVIGKEFTEGANKACDEYNVLMI